MTHNHVGNHITEKGNFNVRSNYRIIVFLSHPSKIFLNVVKNKIKKRIDEDQFDFKSGRGTRESILSLWEMLQRIGMGKSTCMAFVDLKKAFDKVNWKLLFMSLLNTCIDWKDSRFVFNLNKNQASKIEINSHKEEVEIRQGCLLSHYLFNIFIEEAINEIKVNTNGISINGQKIHSIWFADDIALTNSGIWRELKPHTKLLG